eukprot:4968100-Pyramimonas_sp.AAC.1
MESIGKLQFLMGDNAKTAHTSCAALSHQVETRFAEVEKRQRSTADQVQHLTDNIDRLEKILGTMQTVTSPAPITDTYFDREPDTAILVIRAKSMFAE